MLFHSRGIVFRSIKYGETSLISKIYTEQHGLQSYIIKGTRAPKSKIKAGTLQPLTLVDLQAYHRENKNIQHVKELGLAYIFNDLPFNIAKSSIGIFMIEVLLLAIKEEEANDSLFNYLFNTIKELDNLKTSPAIFHLRFLINLSRFLGFSPSGIYSNQDNYFDLQEGVFTSSMPHHPLYLEGASGEQFSLFNQSITNNKPLLELNNQQRKELLQNLLTYYSLHVANFKTIRSIKVLEEVLRG